jgi:hypothetical protein
MSGAGPIRELLLAAAKRRGIKLDVARVLRDLEGVVRAYRRRAQEPEPLTAGIRRTRLVRLIEKLRALEGVLNSLESEEAPQRMRREDGILQSLESSWPRISGVAVPVSDWLAHVYPREHPCSFGDWRVALRRMRQEAERLLLGVSGRPGTRGNPALRELLWRTAWVLGRAGLPLSTYEDGLFARCARAQAAKVGQRLALGDNLRDGLATARRIAQRFL